MTAYTRFPVSTRRSNHAANSKSPRTDNGDGVGANTSPLTVVGDILQYTSRSHIAPLHTSSQTCEQDRFVGETVCLLDPGSTAADLSSA